MKLKLALATFTFLLIPCWATAQERDVPVVAEVDRPSTEQTPDATQARPPQPCPGPYSGYVPHCIPPDRPGADAVGRPNSEATRATETSGGGSWGEGDCTGAGGVVLRSEQTVTCVPGGSPELSAAGSQVQGTTVPGVDIIVKQKPGGAMFQTTTDADGAFSFANLEAGEYVLQFGQPRGIPGAEMDIEVTENGFAIKDKGISIMAWNPHVELTMEVTGRGNLLTGRVRNETTGRDCTSPDRPRLTREGQGGQALERGLTTIPGVDIIVKKKPGGAMFQTTTDANGAFSFANLAPGEYVLQFAQPATIPAAEMDIEVTENGVAIKDKGISIMAWNPHVELTMESAERGNLLTGRVTNETTGTTCSSPVRPRPTR